MAKKVPFIDSLFGAGSQTAMKEPIKPQEEFPFIDSLFVAETQATDKPLNLQPPVQPKKDLPFIDKVISQSLQPAPAPEPVVDEPINTFKGYWNELVNASARGLARVWSAFEKVGTSMMESEARLPRPDWVKEPTAEEATALAKIKKEAVTKGHKTAKMLWEISKHPELAAKKKNLFGKALNLIGETIPYMTATTIGYLSGGPLGGFMPAAIVEGHSSYQEAIGAGVSPEKAKKIGTGVGVVSGAIESVGGRGAEAFFTRTASKLKNKLAKGTALFGIGTIVEALEEGGQEIAALTGETTYRDVDWNEAVGRTLGSMAGGAFLGGVMKGGGVGIRSLLSKAQKPPIVQQPKAVPVTETEPVTPPAMREDMIAKGKKIAQQDKAIEARLTADKTLEGVSKAIESETPILDELGITKPTVAPAGEGEVGPIDFAKEAGNLRPIGVKGIKAEKPQFKVGDEIFLKNNREFGPVKVEKIEFVKADPVSGLEETYVITTRDKSGKEILGRIDQFEPPTPAKAEEKPKIGTKAYAEAKKKELAELEKPKPVTLKGLRQKIGAVAVKRGLTKKALTELKKKHTGFNKLTGAMAVKKITPEQLQTLLKAVEKARPRRIGYLNVVTKKTENKIEKLRTNLKSKIKMTDADFNKILTKEIQSREPKYIDAKHFITETEGKSIIRRMLDEAHVIRVVNPTEQAIKHNKEINTEAEKIKRKIIKKSRGARDPYRLESMRYYNQQAELVTGEPMSAMYQELVDKHSETVRSRAVKWKQLEEVPNFKRIARSEESLKRVSDYIASKSYLERKPQMPADITPDEIALAKAIEQILKEYEHKVRVAKFYNYYYYNQPIPQKDKYAKEITKAVDIFESEGRDALVEYLKTQEWGVIKSGYEPLQVYMPKIRLYNIPGVAVGKGHVKLRLDVKYHSQEKNILQRLNSYMRQIDLLFNLHPQIQAYVRLFDDNFSKFKAPGKVKESIESFLRNLKNYSHEGGFFEQAIARIYSQAMTAVIMDNPVLAFRNTLQNIAFEHDKSILIDPRNKSLTQEDMEYIETYVLQTKAMLAEYFMVGEKPFPGLKFINDIVNKVALYPHSDINNRYWGFWAKKNQVIRALEKGTVKEMIDSAKFSDMTELEQHRALGILAKEGKEAMARYVAKVHVDNIHFLYERAQRSPAEQTSLGRVVGNLFLFPRAYGEKLAHSVNQVMNKNADFRTRYRNLKILLAVIAGGLLIGGVYQIITGRKRNPYNPLEILAFRPGGLAWGSIEAVSEIAANMLLAVNGDERAIAALTTAIPNATDMFIPLYDLALRGYEALTDQKNVDKKALRKLRELIDKEYNIRGGAYKVKRIAVDKWRYFIGGAGVDIKEKPTGRTGRVGRKGRRTR